MISTTAEMIIRDKIAKPLVSKSQQTGRKQIPKTSKENNELIATLRREIEDLKFQRDKQLATKDQQISTKDRQIDRLTKLLDQSQQLQLISEKKAKDSKQIITKKKEFDNNHEKTKNTWWHFW